MKLTNGVDLTEVERIKRSIKNKRFLQRVFSAEELELFESRSMNPQTIAANFAAKEAFAKALGTGVRGFSLNEVSVLRDGLGAPYIKLCGNAEKLALKSGLCFSVSLSHTNELAVAFVTALEK